MSRFIKTQGGNGYVNEDHIIRAYLTTGGVKAHLTNGDVEYLADEFILGDDKVKIKMVVIKKTEILKKPQGTTQ